MPGPISFEVHPQPPPPGRYTTPPTRHISMGWYRYEQHSTCILYENCCMRCWTRPRWWNRWCQSCMAGVAVLRPSYTVRLSRLERSASKACFSTGVPLTRPLAQECFRQRKCREEGLAAPRGPSTTTISL
ncbi:hypothetical protein HDV57DRAFT_134269 [Trichoderma longibrachiatum]